MNDIYIRRKIDLHFGRSNFTGNTNYAEFYFHCCFYELFNIDSSWDSELNGDELTSLLDTLRIDFDLDLVASVYQDQNDHSVEVFHSSSDEQVFAYFDLEKDPTDQNDMFFLGISCLKEQEPEVHEALLNIYRKLKTVSPFSFDILNNQLYNKTFRSYTYFYNGNYNVYKRQMHHHGLNPTFE